MRLESIIGLIVPVKLVSNGGAEFIVENSLGALDTVMLTQTWSFQVKWLGLKSSSILCDRFSPEKALEAHFPDLWIQIYELNLV